MDVREKLVELLTNAIIDSDDNYGFPDTNQVADRLIVNGVTVVVRCKDCNHHYWEQEPCHGKSVHYCKLPHMRGVEVFKEFFCYYGERKDGDGNG